MEIKATTQNEVTVIEITGCIDGNTAPKAEEEIMKYVVPGCRLVLNMSQCNYISSAGLRVLLVIGKQILLKNGSWVFAGLSEEIKDVMDMTGFSNFFKTYTTVNEAVNALRS
ncbi:MAG TPA: anti-sigma B factor antagonist [Elusimicrobia bacterium]|jgi:anti-anti-sigma factor|nr:anti-sigma B factor antagonist [Elusimicrobiota bacterium]